MTVVSNEYANALFSLCREENCIEEVFKSLKTVKDVFDNTEGIFDFLLSPSVALDERLAVIKNAFEGKIHKYAFSAVCVFIKNKSIYMFDEFYGEFASLSEQVQKISFAKVYSAVDLTKEETEKLSEKLEKICGNKVKMQIKTDKSLMGGITVEIDGKLYDGSIKSRLKSIKDVMNG